MDGLIRLNHIPELLSSFQGSKIMAAWIGKIRENKGDKNES